MAEAYLAEIRIFPFNYAPSGWAFCNGQLLPISQYTALFSLLGTYYGGDGRITFALPNLQGSVPIHTTDYSGWSPFGEFPQGEQSGVPSLALFSFEMPMHTHNFQGIDLGAQTAGPQNAAYAVPNWVSGTTRGVVQAYSATANNLVPMNPSAVSLAGGNQPHNNMMPYLTLNFCICMNGIYPPRS